MPDKLELSPAGFGSNCARPGLTANPGLLYLDTLKLTSNRVSALSRYELALELSRLLRQYAEATSLYDCEISKGIGLAHNTFSDAKNNRQKKCPSSRTLQRLKLLPNPSKELDAVIGALLAFGEDRGKARRID